jgi:hypothetical protein
MWSFTGMLDLHPDKANVVIETFSLGKTARSRTERLAKNHAGERFWTPFAVQIWLLQKFER